MRLVLANHSSYPRVGEGSHLQRLRRAYASRETGKIDDEGYEQVVTGYIGEVIAEQQDAGLDLVTDGLVHWYDVISHPASRLEGVKIRGIVRFFDTNTYVRQPEIESTPKGTFGLAPEFERASKLATKDVKAVVTGPYTLARHSILKGNGDLSQTSMAYAEALGAELENLKDAGARIVQIDEPSLLKNPDDAPLVRRLLEIATQAKGDLKVSLTTYFGDATTIYGELLKMPVEMIGFDLIYGPTLLEMIVHEGADRPLALGAIDGRNTKLDDTRVVAQQIERVMEVLDARGVPEVHLQSSCGLEFLPRDRAKRKLDRMREIRRHRHEGIHLNGREKLRKLGIELPILPITAVGSYAKPDELKRARTRFARGDITREELRTHEEEATAMWMGFQNEIGVDVPVDGEMYRGDMVAFFADEMDGFERGGFVRSYGNRFYPKPIITNEVRWRGPMTVDWWRFAQSLTEKPVKGMFTGGYTVMDWSFNEFYRDRKDTALALSTELRKEVEALVDAGCKIIQIDEPAVSVRADEIDVAIEAMHIMTDGLDAYFITHALEYGYPQSVFPDVLQLNVDNFDMEFANSDFAFLQGLRDFGFDKDLSLGVVDSHTHVVESVDDIEHRIRQAVEILPPETIWPDPDCGLKTRTVEESMGKMRAIAEATKRVRADLSSRV